MAPRRWAWMMGLVAALVATSVYSQHRESGEVYMGAALGYHMAPDAERGLDAAYGDEVLSASIDDGVVGWGVYGGFAVSDWLALEAGYLGNTDMEITVRDVATVDLSTSAFYAAVVAHFPMRYGSAVYPFLKVGMAQWDTEASWEDGDRTYSADDDGTDVLFGVGVDVPGVGTTYFRGEYILLWIDDEDGGYQHRIQAGVNFTF